MCHDWRLMRVKRYDGVVSACSSYIRSQLHRSCLGQSVTKTVGAKLIALPLAETSMMPPQQPRSRVSVETSSPENIGPVTRSEVRSSFG